jgi:DNA-binding LytR/AlgR family response regulator
LSVQYHSFWLQHRKAVCWLLLKVANEGSLLFFNSFIFYTACKRTFFIAKFVLLLQDTPTPSSSAGLLPVKTIDGIVFVDFSAIIRFEADGKRTLVYIKNESNAVRSILSISIIEEMLPHAFFFKCHRSHIIGLRHLKKFVRDERKIQLTDNHCIPISEDRICDFLKYADPTYTKNK